MLRELDQRIGDGVTVTLSWDDEEDVVVLHVDDHGATAVTSIRPERALDAFEHPFLYLTPVRCEPPEVEPATA